MKKVLSLALRLFSYVLRIGVTGLLFFLLFSPETFGLSPDTFGGVKPRDMLNELQGAGIGNVVLWLGFALIVKLAAIFCGMIRWRLLLRGQGLRMPTRYLAESWFVGRMFGIFMPGTIGLDGYRLYDSSRYTGEVIKCTTVIAVEKLTGFVALTGLVFLTFPLGMQVINIKLPMLAAIMIILSVFVVVFFLLLLNPRVIQVLVAVVPTPRMIRNPLNKLGAAATAYSGNRSSLILAVFFGVLSHFGTCLMYFGTAMAIRADNVDLMHILFASPLVIYGTVVGPSVGGEGIREFGFLALLATGAGATAAAAVTLAHLGWWVGEVVPFLIGAVVFVLRKHPERAELQAEVAEARREAAAAQAAALQALHFAPKAVQDYRRKIFGMLFCGVFAGAYAGAFIGMGESTWLLYRLGHFAETGMFWWGALVYSIVFAGVGLGVAGALLFLCLLVDRFPKWPVTFGIAFGVPLGFGALILGLWRYKRDVLLETALSKAELLTAGQLSMGLILEGFLAAALIALIVSALFKQRAVLLFLTGLVVYGGCIAAAFAASLVTHPAPKPILFGPGQQAQGPNIIFVTIDALRGDYLKMFRDRPAIDNTAQLSADVNRPEGQQPLNPYRSASVETPALEAFARDALLFENAFAQASWTKPCYATMFTGLYPEDHNAIHKMSVLPDEVNTIAELLLARGYYTKGFPNNPNVHPLFNFEQGHVEYTYLEPDRIYGAPASAASLTIYEILRRGVKPRIDRLFNLKMNVREAYQPAEVVTGRALEWIGEVANPKAVPFYLYLHYMDTHDPFMDPDAPRGGYARATMDKPSPALDEAMEKAYCLEIQHLDKYLGELFEGLKRLKLYDNSLIVLTADHGEEFCDHGGFWHGQTLYDEVLHVPLIIKLPGSQHAGERSADLARHIDLVPTMLHFAGLEKSPALPGQSLFDAQGNLTNAGIRFSYAHNDLETNTLHAVRSLDMKLIESKEGPKYYRGLPAAELYDMKTNPDERWDQNLIDDPARAPVRDEYGNALRTQGSAASAAPAAAEHAPAVPAQPETPPDNSGNAALREQLGALGYVE